jgi:glycosyltransferase involved in cell wall biosynthesis
VLSEADVLVTSSWAFAHRFQTANHAPQACYCHSPLRFAWSMTDTYRDRWTRGPLSRAAFRAFVAAMRRSDRRASRRVDKYLTQSPFVAEQINRFYGRPAKVIGAPVDCETFKPAAADPEDYFLFAGRLVEPHKRAAVTVEAFRGLPHRLLVAGDGPDRARQQASAPENVEFLGHLEDRDLADVMRRCRAVIFPSPDPFGLVPLEAMACGRPVLAYAESGAKYTVVPGRTGALFGHDDPETIARAVREFDPDSYDPQTIRAHALQWDRTAFRERLVAEVGRVAARS